MTYLMLCIKIFLRKLLLFLHKFIIFLFYLFFGIIINTCITCITCISFYFMTATSARNPCGIFKSKRAKFLAIKYGLDLHNKNAYIHSFNLISYSDVKLIVNYLWLDHFLYNTPKPLIHISDHEYYNIHYSLILFDAELYHRWYLHFLYNTQKPIIDIPYNKYIQISYLFSYSYV